MIRNFIGGLSQIDPVEDVQIKKESSYEETSISIDSYEGIEPKMLLLLKSCGETKNRKR